MSSPCVRSGYCCSTSVCAFGTWDADAGHCEHLLGKEPGTFECGIHDKIIEHPDAALNPAFGAGCCSPLFNVSRDEVFARAKEEARRTLYEKHPSNNMAIGHNQEK